MGNALDRKNGIDDVSPGMPIIQTIVECRHTAADIREGVRRAHGFALTDDEIARVVNRTIRVADRVLIAASNAADACKPDVLPTLPAATLLSLDAAAGVRQRALSDADILPEPRVALLDHAAPRGRLDCRSWACGLGEPGDRRVRRGKFANARPGRKRWPNGSGGATGLALGGTDFRSDRAKGRSSDGGPAGTAAGRRPSRARHHGRACDRRCRSPGQRPSHGSGGATGLASPSIMLPKGSRGLVKAARSALSLGAVLGLDQGARLPDRVSGPIAGVGVDTVTFRPTFAGLKVDPDRHRRTIHGR